MDHNDATILIISDVVSDAELVLGLLKADYPQTQTATDAKSFGEAFERCRPQVLVLAFQSVEAAERCYLGLYRHSTLVGTLPHRTLILCDKNDVRRVYELCSNGYFDDYTMFWPLVHDAPRLPMSVHIALRALDGEDAVASVAQFSAQARRITELEALLERQIEVGRSHAVQAQVAMEQAQQQVGSALERFEHRLNQGGLDDAMVVHKPEQLKRELNRLNEESFQVPLRQAVQALKPVRQWVDGLKTQFAGPMDAATVLASKVRRPLLLVVDDEAIMRKLLTQVMGAARYDVEAVSSASDALAWLRKRRPDLILMDVQMPDIDGITLTRQLKAARAYASIPVMMLTGRAEKQVIVDCLGAGASDFIVKPFDRDTLLIKVEKILAGGLKTA